MSAVKHVRSSQVYDALMHAAEKIGMNNYRSGLVEHIRSGKVRKTYRYTPSSEHAHICKMAGDLSFSDEECMAFLHTYEVMQQRFGKGD